MRNHTIRLSLFNTSFVSVFNLDCMWCTLLSWLHLGWSFIIGFIRDLVVMQRCVIRQLSWIHWQSLPPAPPSEKQDLLPVDNGVCLCLCLSEWERDSETEQARSKKKRMRSKENPRDNLFWSTSQKMTTEWGSRQKGLNICKISSSLYLFSSHLKWSTTNGKDACQSEACSVYFENDRNCNRHLARF